MFCPKCGQSQPTEASRFCPRCGFPLVGVADLLARDGAPAYPAAAGPRALSPKRSGMRQGGAIMLVGAFLTPFIAMLHPIIGLPGEFTLLGVIVLLAGLLRFLFAAIFADSTPAVPQPYAPPATQSQFDPRARAARLGAADFRPARSLFPRRQETAEIVRPPASVTDHTTRLLAHEDDPAER